MIPHDNCALWLYGSHSRGDADDFSDVDVLFVSENGQFAELDEHFVEQRSNLSISNYSWNEIGRMRQYGSLFLHHIQLEGRPILEGRWARGRMERILSSLGPYQRASGDLLSFKTVLNDISISLDDGQASLYFELSTLATVIRHTAILGCSLVGEPCFSRNDPIGRLATHWNLPQKWVAEFPQIYVYRLYAAGRAPRPRHANAKYAMTWCNRLHQMLCLLEHHAHQKS